MCKRNTRPAFPRLTEMRYIVAAFGTISPWATRSKTRGAVLPVRFSSASHHVGFAPFHDQDLLPSNLLTDRDCRTCTPSCPYSASRLELDRCVGVLKSPLCHWLASLTRLEPAWAHTELVEPLTAACIHPQIMLAHRRKCQHEAEPHADRQLLYLGVR